MDQESCRPPRVHSLPDIQLARKVHRLINTVRKFALPDWFLLVIYSLGLRIHVKSALEVSDSTVHSDACNIRDGNGRKRS